MAASPRYFVGLDFGGTNIKIGVVSLDGTVISNSTTPIGIDRTVEAVVNQMAEVVNNVIVSSKVDRSAIFGVGIGSPGLLDCANGIIYAAANFHGWVNVEICKLLSAKLGGIRCVLENDANAAAAAENWIGAGKTTDSLVMMCKMYFVYAFNLLSRPWDWDRCGDCD